MTVSSSTFILLVGLLGYDGIHVLSNRYNGVATAAVIPLVPISSIFWRNGDVPIISDAVGWRRRTSSKSQSRFTNGLQETIRAEDEPDADDNEPSQMPTDEDDSKQWREDDEFETLQRPRHRKHRASRKRSRETSHTKNFFSKGSSLNSLRKWTFDKTGIRIPRIVFCFDPITIVKIRKSWHHVIPGVIIRLGADFETQYRLGGGIWRLRGCFEDKFIGGRLTIREKRSGEKGLLMEYSKSWPLSSAGDAATRIYINAQYDIDSHRGRAQFGFRTENMGTIGKVLSSPGIFGSRRQRFSIIPIIPLDGPEGHVKVEAKTNIDLPEPDVSFGMDLDDDSSDNRSFGMCIGSDVNVEVEELNLLFLLE